MNPNTVNHKGKKIKRKHHNANESNNKMPNEFKTDEKSVPKPNEQHLRKVNAHIFKCVLFFLLSNRI